jgi:hypothetical protein
LQYKITGCTWSDCAIIDFANSMSAADVLKIAKHFYNNYPNIQATKTPFNVNAILRLFKRKKRKDVVKHKSLQNRVVYAKIYSKAKSVLGGLMH